MYNENKIQINTNRGFGLGINYHGYPFKHTVTVHLAYLQITMGFGKHYTQIGY